MSAIKLIKIRLSIKGTRLRKALAKKLGLSKNDVIERAIRLLWTKEDSEAARKAAEEAAIKTRVCSSCALWKKKIGMRTQAGRFDVGFCQSPTVIQPRYGERDNTHMVKDGVLTCDEGGYTGELLTGPSFGCLHWKAA